MSTPTRYLAGIAAAAVATTGLAVAVPSSARAAETDATLSWAFSAYVQTPTPTGQFPNHTVGGGAIETDGVVTFGGGTGAVHTGDGEADLQYHGTATFARTGSYSVTIADPEITVDAAGHGKVLADVSYSVGPASPTDAGVHTLTTFTASAADWSGSTLAATPDWDDVAPADTYGAGKPVNGESWSTDFVQTLPSSIQAFFYASGSSATSDAKKAPAAFTAVAAEAAAPVLTPTVISSTPANGVTWSVAGNGFRGVTQPGDAGVYVGLAPAGGLPDVSSQDGMAAFAAAAWVPATAIADGAFTTTLTAPTDKLDPSTSYALYTWQAHAHSNTTQDTETPVTIDWGSLVEQPGKQAVTLTAAGPTAVTYGRGATLSVALPAAATGTVTLTGIGAAQAVAVKGGAARFAVPTSLAPGSYRASFAYAGDAGHSSATATRSLVVGKAKAAVSTAWKKKPTLKKKGKLRVAVAGVSGAAAPTGTVKAVLTHGKKKVKAKATVLKSGAIVLTVKKLPKKGAWKVAVTYAGDAHYSSAVAQAKTKVKKK